MRSHGCAKPHKSRAVRCRLSRRPWSPRLARNSTKSVWGQKSRRSPFRAYDRGALVGRGTGRTRDSLADDPSLDVRDRSGFLTAGCLRRPALGPGGCAFPRLERLWSRENLPIEGRAVLRQTLLDLRLLEELLPAGEERLELVARRAMGRKR